jgi:hypothetical protein
MFIHINTIIAVHSQIYEIPLCMCVCVCARLHTCVCTCICAVVDWWFFIVKASGTFSDCPLQFEVVVPKLCGIYQSGSCKVESGAHKNH